MCTHDRSLNNVPHRPEYDPRVIQCLAECVPAMEIQLITRVTKP